jgi:hypothetical protein
VLKWVSRNYVVPSSQDAFYHGESEVKKGKKGKKMQ